MFGEKPVGRTKVQILKIRGGQNVHVQFRAAEPLAFHIHWVGDRSFICPGDDCPACHSSLGSRWVGILPVVWFTADQKQAYSGVLELTTSAYERLCGLLRMEGRMGLLGLQVHASRRTDRSPLRVEPVPVGAEIAAPCKAVEQDFVADAVSTIWGLPACVRGMKLKEWEARAMPRARALLGVAVGKLPCNA